jgi:uncharacterized protein
MAEPEKKASLCPICGKPAEPDFKPFCSRRCAAVDLHRWLDGAYVIAGQDEADEEEPLSGRDDF